MPHNQLYIEVKVNQIKSLIFSLVGFQTVLPSAIDILLSLFRDSVLFPQPTCICNEGEYGDASLGR